MKIGVYHSNLNYFGGAERTLQDLIEGFLARNWETIIATRIKPTNCYSFYKNYANLIYGYDSEPERFALYKRLDQEISIINKLLDTDPDITYFDTPMFGGTTVKEVLDRGKTPVIYVHNIKDLVSAHYPGITNYEGGDPIKYFYYKSYINRIKRNEHYLNKAVILSNGSYTSNELRNKLHINSVIVYPAADLNKFSPDPSRKEKDLIVAISRFNEHKKLDRAIDLYRTLYFDLKKKVKIIIAGGCHPSNLWYVDSLKKMAEGLDIEFKINLKDEEVVDLYRRAKLFLFPAGDSEPFGTVNLEAQACGTPCIVIGRGGGAEDIVDQNVSGVKTPDTKEAARVIKSLLDDDTAWGKLSLGAIENVKKFGRESFQNKICSILSDITGK